MLVSIKRLTFATFHKDLLQAKALSACCQKNLCFFITLNFHPTKKKVNDTLNSAHPRPLFVGNFCFQMKIKVHSMNVLECYEKQGQARVFFVCPLHQLTFYTVYFTKLKNCSILNLKYKADSSVVPLLKIYLMCKRYGPYKGLFIAFEKNQINH